MLQKVNKNEIILRNNTENYIGSLFVDFENKFFRIITVDNSVKIHNAVDLFPVDFLYDITASEPCFEG